MGTTVRHLSFVSNLLTSKRRKFRPFFHLNYTPHEKTVCYYILQRNVAHAKQHKKIHIESRNSEANIQKNCIIGCALFFNDNKLNFWNIFHAFGNDNLNSNRNAFCATKNRKSIFRKEHCEC